MEKDKVFKDIELAIRKILELKKCTAKDLALGIGKTESGMAYMFKNQSLTLATLISIANFLNVDIEVFLNQKQRNKIYTFENNNSIVSESTINYGSQRGMIDALQNEIKALKEMIVAKDSIIAAKDDLIAILKK